MLTSADIALLSADVPPLLQFQKDVAGKAEAAKMQAMAQTYGLQSIVPNSDIKPHIQETMSKVLLTATSCAVLFSC